VFNRCQESGTPLGTFPYGGAVIISISGRAAMLAVVGVAGVILLGRALHVCLVGGARTHYRMPRARLDEAAHALPLCSTGPAVGSRTDSARV
jgi:hypothetical protein